MTHVTIECPECHRGCVYNGRGRCLCGAYLIDHWDGANKGSRLTIPDAQQGKPVYVRENGAWKVLRDGNGELVRPKS